MTNTIDMDLLDPAQAGIYCVTSADLDALDDMGRQSGSLVCRINLEGCREKADLLQRFADAFDFPDSFGHNWDALEDSLGDLDWLPADGYLLLIDGINDLREAEMAECDTLFELLDENSRTWADTGIAFFSFIALTDDRIEADEDDDSSNDDDLLDDDDLMEDDDA